MGPSFPLPVHSYSICHYICHRLVENTDEQISNDSKKKPPAAERKVSEFFRKEHLSLKMVGEKG